MTGDRGRSRIEVFRIRREFKRANRYGYVIMMKISSAWLSIQSMNNLNNLLKDSDVFKHQSGDMIFA